VQLTPGGPDLRPGNRIFGAPPSKPVPSSRLWNRQWVVRDGVSVGTLRERLPAFHGSPSLPLIRLVFSPRSNAKLLKLALRWRPKDDAVSVGTRYTDI